MPQPVISVPAFPNVPFAPGVPPLARSVAGAVNTLTGTTDGSFDTVTGALTGSVAGLLTQSGGEVTAITATLRGVLDDVGNVSGVLQGVVGGNLTGALTGVIDRVSGVVQGGISGVVSQLTGGTIGALTDSGDVSAQTEPFIWGIFTAAGAAAITGDTVVALDYRAEWQVSNYPVEQGGFQSYNKVEEPYLIRVTFTKGGTEQERTDFLASVDAAIKSLDLYSVLTPEKTYANVNVTGQSMRRVRDNGATLLTVEVMCQQIRETATAAFSNTKEPSGAGDVNAGSVQTAPPTTTQTANAGSARGLVPR